MFNLLLMLLWAAAGFVLGLSVIGGLSGLRSHPRYLMAIGALIMPTIWAYHAIVGTRPLLYGPDLLFLMAGLGALVAGWDAEAEAEQAYDEERRRRLRAKWESQKSRSIGIDESDSESTRDGGGDVTPATTEPSSEPHGRLQNSNEL